MSHSLYAHCTSKTIRSVQAGHKIMDLIISRCCELFEEMHIQQKCNEYTSRQAIKMVNEVIQIDSIELKYQIDHNIWNQDDEPQRPLKDDRGHKVVQKQKEKQMSLSQQQLKNRQMSYTAVQQSRKKMYGDQVVVQKLIKYQDEEKIDPTIGTLCQVMLERLANIKRNQELIKKIKEGLVAKDKNKNQNMNKNVKVCKDTINDHEGNVVKLKKIKQDKLPPHILDVHFKTSRQFSSTEDNFYQKSNKQKDGFKMAVKMKIKTSNIKSRVVDHQPQIIYVDKRKTQQPQEQKNKSSKKEEINNHIVHIQQDQYINVIDNIVVAKGVKLVQNKRTLGQDSNKLNDKTVNMECLLQTDGFNKLRLSRKQYKQITKKGNRSQDYTCSKNISYNTEENVLMNNGKRTSIRDDDLEEIKYIDNSDHNRTKNYRSANNITFNKNLSSILIQNQNQIDHDFTKIHQKKEKECRNINQFINSPTDIFNHTLMNDQRWGYQHKINDTTQNLSQSIFPKVKKSSKGFSTMKSVRVIN